MISSGSRLLSRLLNKTRFRIMYLLKRALFLLMGLNSPVTGYSQSSEKVQVVPFSVVNNIIPKPVSLVEIKGRPVDINNFTRIAADQRFSDQASYLREQLHTQCGLQLSVLAKVSKKDTPNAILLTYDSLAVTRPEMYLLSIKNRQVELKAKDTGGIVHGIQTLLQLLPLKPRQHIILPSLQIEDYPRFGYRGMHLDVSRHFFQADFVKKYIDYLAFHKFNNFHWHLTDDHGWRIEIKSYPKLTEVGAWRDSTLIGHFKDRPIRHDRTRHGGFYSQEQVKDIINYAQVRGINIIPEIDIPGHSRAAMAAYPELSTRPDTAWKVATGWGMFNRQNNVLAPTAATFEFLKRTFDEIADLFPSPYIHIGGDECSKIWWKADPKTQSFMKEKGLRDEVELQAYFIKTVVENLKLKGKKVIGWDEIIEGDLDTSAVIMNWRGVESAIHAAERNHKVIMSPGPPLYFDYYQSRDKVNDSIAIFGYTPLDAVYNYTPVSPKIDSLRLQGQILGAQANVWTEFMLYPSKVEYMVFPRLTALSEVLWTPEGKRDFLDFKRRLTATAIPRYKFWNSSYFKDYEKWTIDKK